jgi:hypothetical protein
MSTSPGSSASITRRSCARSVLAPLTCTSRNTFLHPALVSCRVCASASTVSIKRPCDVVVSAHVSPTDLKPAFLAVIAASVFNRSRVDRAGQKMGRPFKLTDHQKREAIKRRDQGETLADIARSYNVSPATISRLAA